MFDRRVVVVYTALLLATVLSQRNPYSTIEAESFDINSGILSVQCSTSSNSKCVGHIDKGDYFGYKSLNFSAETVAVQLRLGSKFASHPEHKFLLRLDSSTSPPFATHTVDSTGDWSNLITATVFIALDQRPRGVHDLYFTFQHPTLDYGYGSLDWLTFVALDSLQPPSKTQSVVSCPTAQPVPCSAPTVTEKSSVSTDKHCNTEITKEITINIY